MVTCVCVCILYSQDLVDNCFIFAVNICPLIKPDNRKKVFFHSGRVYRIDQDYVDEALFTSVRDTRQCHHQKVNKFWARTITDIGSSVESCPIKLKTKCKKKGI